MKYKNMNSIKKTIRKAGHTQMGVAMHLGIRADSLSTAITRRTLTVEQLEMIAEYINVPVWELLRDSDSVLACPHCKKPVKVNLVK